MEQQSNDQFNNISIDKKANIYFNGKVTSRTIEFGDGSKKTLGIMMPGEYSFNTGLKELMEITSGSLKFQLAGETSWNQVDGGQSFEVPANSSFKVNVQQLTDYCCHFIEQ